MSSPLWNPTPTIIRAQHGGMFAIFQPQQQLEIFDGYAAKHLVERWGKFGLVDLSYGPKEREKYADYDDFVHAKRIQGLRNLVATLTAKVEGFKIYDYECGDKKSVERIHFASGRKEAEKELETAVKLLKDAEEGKGLKTPEQKAAALKKQAQDLLAQADKLEHGRNASKSS